VFDFEDQRHLPKIPDMHDGGSETHQPTSPTDKGEGWLQGSQVEDDSINPTWTNPAPNKLQLSPATEILGEPIKEIEYLWGNIIPKGSIAILNSVAGVGKTTLCYNLAVYGSEAISFAGMQFPRPIRTLYADLESGFSLRQKKLRRICDEFKPENLCFLHELDVIRDHDELKGIINESQADLLIIDTINEGFNTRDEQDNAEANRQFRYIKNLRDETGCSILLIAHIGKLDQNRRVYSARGASARSASVDVVLNLTEITKEELCLSIEKDRFGGGREKLYLKKIGKDCFEAIEKTEDDAFNQQMTAEKFILEKIDEGLANTGEFIESGKDRGYSKPTIERALHNLHRTGQIVRLRKGVYSKIPEINKNNPSII
jgi:DNA repair protein RadA/Sms